VFILFIINKIINLVLSKHSMGTLILLIRAIRFRCRIEIPSAADERNNPNVFLCI